MSEAEIEREKEEDEEEDELMGKAEDLINDLCRMERDGYRAIALCKLVTPIYQYLVARGLKGTALARVRKQIHAMMDAVEDLGGALDDVYFHFPKNAKRKREKEEDEEKEKEKEKQVQIVASEYLDLLRANMPSCTTEPRENTQ